jgi:hypothetical protein
MARFSKLKGQAILADIMEDKVAIIARHKKGLNVLYGHGGAHWVDLKAINKSPWNMLQGSSSAAPNWSYSMNLQAVWLDDGRWMGPSPYNPGTAYTPKAGVWVDLDRAD